MTDQNTHDEHHDSTVTADALDDDRLPPTFRYQGPVDDRTFTQELGKVTKIDIPVFAPVCTIRRDRSLDARRSAALDAGAAAFNRISLLNLKVLSKRLTRDVFAEETRLLERMLSEVRCAVTSDNSDIFAVDSTPFSRLVKRLNVLRQRARDSFLIAGSAIPSLPTWGRDGDITEFHGEDDFKILGVCFRAEVEDFLWRIQDRQSQGNVFSSLTTDTTPNYRRNGRETAATRSSTIQPPRSQFKDDPTVRLRTMPPCRSENEYELVTRSSEIQPPRSRIEHALTADEDDFANRSPTIPPLPFRDNADAATTRSFAVQPSRSSTIHLPRTRDTENATARASATEPSRTRVNDGLAAGKERRTHLSAPSIPGHTPVLAAIFEPVGRDSLKIVDGEVSKSEAIALGKDWQGYQQRRLAARERNGQVNYGAGCRPRIDYFSSASRQPRNRPYPRNRDHPGDPDGSDDSDDDDGHGSDRPPNRRPSTTNPRSVSPIGGQIDESLTLPPKPTIAEPHFDLKLKFDSVPRWDGDTDSLARWFLKVNALAKLSPTVSEQLGTVVPKRLEGSAETWYWSLPVTYRAEIERNWDALRTAIGTYYMNRKWLDRQKAKANRASYRETTYVRETPSEYFIRKSDLLNTVYSLSDAELIMEVMDGAPASWNTVLTTQLYDTALDFQSAIRFHEDTLMRLDTCHQPQHSYGDHPRDANPFHDTQAALVGWSGKMSPPSFPQDDSNVSAMPTPGQKGARPCQYCGSGNHWDLECKFVYQGARAARRNRTECNDGELSAAQVDYNDLYYGLDSDKD